MRISSLHIYNQGVQAFNTQQEKIAILQEQISSGVRLTKPSDDPAAAARVLELEQTVAVNEQYNVNITLAENRLRLQDTTLNSIENTYFRLKELAIQAGNGINSSGNLNSIKAEIEERYNELLYLANTRDNSGNYLYAGTSNADAPFELTVTGSTEHVIYHGDQNYRSYQISETRQIQSDNNGSDLFLEVPSDYGLNDSTTLQAGSTGEMSPPMVTDTTTFLQGTYNIVFTGPVTYSVIDVDGVHGAPLGSNTPGQTLSSNSYTDSEDIEFAGIRTSITGTPVTGDVYTVSEGQYRSIFETVETFIDTLGDIESEELTSDLGTIMNDLDGFFDHVLDVRTTVGARLNALETQKDDNSAYVVSIQSTLSSLRDTDLAEAISQLTIEQTTLDAAQAVFSRITGSSLFDYLR